MYDHTNLSQLLRFCASVPKNNFFYVAGFDVSLEMSVKLAGSET